MRIKSIDLIKKGVSKLHKIPDFIHYKISLIVAYIMSLNSFNHQSNIIDSSEIIWSDKPEKISMKIDNISECPENKLRHLRSINGNSDRNEVYHQPFKRFVCKKDNVLLLGGSNMANSCKDFRIVFLDDRWRVIGQLPYPDRVTNRQFLHTELTQVIHNIGILGSAGKILNSKYRPPDVKYGILLSSKGDRVYGHWLLEHVPMIQRLQKFEDVTGIRAKILLREDISNWKLEILRMLGYSQQDWVRLKDESVLVENLVVTDRKNAGSYYWDLCSEDLNWISSELCKKVDEEQSFSNKVLISRQNSRRRHILNFDEVKNYLSNRGFEAYDVGDMSRQDQINLFAHADTVIGPIGSELANTIFGEDMNIICLYPFEPWSVGFCYPLAEACGHKFIPIVSDPVPSEENVNPHERDIHVDVEELDKILDEFM